MDGEHGKVWYTSDGRLLLSPPKVHCGAIPKPISLWIPVFCMCNRSEGAGPVDGFFTSSLLTHGDWTAFVTPDPALSIESAEKGRGSEDGVAFMLIVAISCTAHE